MRPGTVLIGCETFSIDIFLWCDLAVDTTPDLGGVHPLPT